jgi:MFS family permease
MYGLEETALDHGDASWRPVVPLAVGVVALATFWSRNRRAEHKVVDVRLFELPGFTAAVTAAATSGALLFGTGLLFPLYFQLVAHDDTVATGVHLLGLAGPTALVLPLVGRVVDRRGPRWPAVTGSALMAGASLGFIALPVPVPTWSLHVLLALLGVGVALAAVPPGVAAYKTVPAENLPDATVVVNIVQRLSGALGGLVFALTLAAHSKPEGGIEAAWWVMTGLAAASLGAAVRIDSGPRHVRRTADGP